VIIRPDGVQQLAVRLYEAPHLLEVAILRCLYDGGGRLLVVTVVLLILLLVHEACTNTQSNRCEIKQP
jgi:hypothetical protein